MCLWLIWVVNLVLSHSFPFFLFPKSLWPGISQKLQIQILIEDVLRGLQNRCSSHFWLENIVCPSSKMNNIGSESLGYFNLSFTALWSIFRAYQVLYKAYERCKAS